MRYTIGNCLIPELLEQRGWTQKLLAEKSGVSESAISTYTKAVKPSKNMTLEVAIALSDVLEVHPRELFEFSPIKRSSR